MKRTCIAVVILGMVLLISVLGIYYALRNIKNDKSVLMILLLSIVTFVGSTVLSTDIIADSVYDIKNQAYIVYEGDFSISEYKGHGYCLLTIYDEKKTDLEIDVYVLDSGQYTGKVVYAEKNKKVLEVQVR